MPGKSRIYPMTKAFGTYTIHSKYIIVHLDIHNGAFRSFKLDRSFNERSSHLYGRAYSEADLWAKTHGAQLETFRAE